MRSYALLFGALVTVAMAYVAQVAVVSSRVAGSANEADPPLTGPLWYGGMLEPVTIQAGRSGGPAIALRGERPESQATQCRAPGAKYRRISGGDQRSKLGVAM